MRTGPQTAQTKYWAEHTRRRSCPAQVTKKVHTCLWVIQCNGEKYYHLRPTELQQIVFNIVWSNCNLVFNAAAFIHHSACHNSIFAENPNVQSSTSIPAFKPIASAIRSPSPKQTWRHSFGKAIVYSCARVRRRESSAVLPFPMPVFHLAGSICVQWSLWLTIYFRSISIHHFLKSQISLAFSMGDFLSEILKFYTLAGKSSSFIELTTHVGDSTDAGRYNIFFKNIFSYIILFLERID